MNIDVTISIHALLAESDVMHALKFADAMLFLSTLSLRRATASRQLPATEPPNFYPRSPCGERRGCGQYCIRAQGISIHALLAESDPGKSQSSGTGIAISIHALLAESDLSNVFARGAVKVFLSTLSLRRATCALRQLQSALCHFYPRSPCGERLLLISTFTVPLAFLSTLSLRRATASHTNLPG